LLGFFLSFREGLFERHNGVFTGGGESESSANFGKRWGWYSVIMMLCNDDILKMEAVTKLNINETLTYISYIKERNKVNKKK
tara:strand:- start:378 stop:623 length:246 start_codon:yes stop_codon:yes gene_type:complete